LADTVKRTGANEKALEPLADLEKRLSTTTETTKQVQAQLADAIKRVCATEKTLEPLGGLAKELSDMAAECKKLGKALADYNQGAMDHIKLLGDEIEAIKKKLKQSITKTNPASNEHYARINGDCCFPEAATRFDLIATDISEACLVVCPCEDQEHIGYAYVYISFYKKFYDMTTGPNRTYGLKLREMFLFDEHITDDMVCYECVPAYCAIRDGSLHVEKVGQIKLKKSSVPWNKGNSRSTNYF